MAEQTHPAFDAAGEGTDTRALARQLGSADELTTLSPTASPHHLAKIHSRAALRDFLHWYQGEILPQELRHIHAAAGFAGLGHVRELLAFDAGLEREPVLRDFQSASRQVGRRQLNRMRPQRDLRLVQRYREAVTEGRAYGWHTLVYGVVLATYSLPLRQGLLHYGRQTLGGFIDSAARTLELRDDACCELQAELDGVLPPLIERTVAPAGGAFSLQP